MAISSKPAAPKPKKTKPKTKKDKLKKAKVKKEKAAKGAKAAAGKTGRKKSHKFALDCSHPVEDGILNVGDFEKFMKERIKVNNKLNNLGNNVTLAREKNKLTVTTDITFSKRYLKYLTKKYLKKFQLRDYLHVVASHENKRAYDLRYFKIGDDEAAADE
eukprot:TRINITY_DN1397_c0_g2_i2.p1 TRINITY_DN1397_c0_g2~~TRINITY_DN1397_c0_g2_i2.p1  ORF type:complete len:160 (+),score=46.53 TRINITY_DN1397_c0_g2_i2:1-480(+)